MGCSFASSCSALPAPYHAGRKNRDWDQLKTQGIARRSAQLAAPVRRAGREPIVLRSTTSIGVAWRKNSTKPGSWTRPRYDFMLTWDRSSNTSASPASFSLLLRTERELQAVPAKSSSKLYVAVATVPYFCPITSPCSVTRRSPAKVPCGKASRKRWVGPAPRLTVPPRP